MLALVVEDSRAMRTIVGNIAEDIGYETVQASDGVDALKQIKAGLVPDLMLVDWNMPNMNGLELVKKVREVPELQETIIVMVTTESEIDRVSAALSAGANEYVMKPFTKDVLSEKLQSLPAMRGLV